MCLDYCRDIEEINIQKENRHNVGYKIFKKDLYGKLRGLYFDAKNLPIGVWLNEKDYRCPSYSYNFLSCVCSNKSYETGFHIYITYEDADYNMLRSYNQIIRKVYFRNIVAEGIQNKCNIIVTKEMFIVPLKKKRVEK